MKTDSRQSGKKGEDLACRHLKKDKYIILEKNYRCKQGEIDIIAEDRAGVLCFVEVKARTREDYGSAIEAVTPSNRKSFLQQPLFILRARR